MVTNILPFPLSAIPTDPWDAKRKLKGGDFGATLQRKRAHRGTDWSRYHIQRLKLSDRIPAVAAGVVVGLETRDKGELGRIVEILDGEGVYWSYCHLALTSVRLGQVVELGELIGVIGQSGTAASVDHLHLMASWTRNAAAGGVVFDPVAHILARLDFEPESIIEEIEREDDVDILIGIDSLTKGAGNDYFVINPGRNTAKPVKNMSQVKFYEAVGMITHHDQGRQLIEDYKIIQPNQSV